MSRVALICGLLCVQLVAAEEILLSPRHVAVTGTAITRVQPDTIVWDVSIVRAHRDLAMAQSSCDEAVKQVLALAKELKLKPEDVQTGHLSIQKIFDRDQSGNQTSFRHYLATRSVTLKQRDTSKFDQMLSRLVGEAEVEASYQLESSQYHELRAKTRLDAARAARAKATAMTELLGAKLGRVLRIAEPAEFWPGGGFQVSNSASSGARQAEPDAAPGSFAPGEIQIRVSVDVAFEIE